ncbi:MAG: bifunctional phosphopantothenoylcysteine decarboxylase/phosphopantothenate--cysteine ligase CoaBC [Anaerolineales bacterium]|nr:bifunctional phosphopantothenoylcysteine decarboxylase/phosphopantothenate--cysteine ligase CoaBC [Anaerolineales bacterium]MCK5633865.1 bifunctional phosphopantothenoylcysteine decarboxylase/phosphopantothenate--cysteine ligase CoaBC [Anaerolineales bacterium]
MQITATIPILKNRRILLGVTGSIAAYKAADLASMLTRAGMQVDVILSTAARKFVTPLTFQSVTGRKAYTESDLWGEEAHVLHVGLVEGADAFLIAPATANTIAKLATGQAESLLTLTALAARCPLIVAPAMDVGMYEHNATQENVKILHERGVIFAGPAEGRMASGLIGKGRMLEPTELMGTLRQVLGQAGPLDGLKIVVTTGGTHEPVDPVRVLANRSSGKQGFSLAQAAIDLGGSVVLIAGPTMLPTPVGARRIDVTTAAEMLEATQESVENADVLLMAAAVADFRPSETVKEKIKRSKDVPTITLERTDDILAAVSQQKTKSGWPRLIVGFAAESQDLIKNAQRKLNEKELDLIVANDITAVDAGFAVDSNRVTLLDRAGGSEELPLMAKSAVAEEVLDKVVELLGAADDRS